ncbi:hypothetical protein [Chitinophaga qingshengii]|uniref:T9SS type A sorting domain-containing protein n=1 Tax=Chitinophaga qingshengii TaxID=1569794 RepID=A0ABR7TJB6_9BACT|nr:hypothetical protein [Chitinophaga qingshengii]MBC9930578.1 hypothetical protein [Chitinophaga qingshengii]
MFIPLLRSRKATGGWAFSGIRLMLLTGLLLLPFLLLAQTSWTGSASTAWSNNANWTAGVPNSTVDAVIGDANFTGSFAPTVNESSSCRSLTVGAGTNVTLSINKNLIVAGNLVIAAGSTLTQKGTSLTVKGDWTNGGTYTSTNNNAKVIFAGITQAIGGTATTTFRKLDIAIGSVTTQKVNITVSGAFSVEGTFIPADLATPVVVSGNAGLSMLDGAVLQVNAATLAGNYALTGAVTLSPGSIVNYSGTLVNQTISNSLTYGTLMISGTGTKTLAGNLNSLNATTATSGNIIVSSGTLDLSSFTANRGTAVAGGALTVANNATLKVGGTNSLPLNYRTVSFSLTSTVEYSGTNQTVTQQTYGNLTLSSGSGAAVKTFPSSSFTVAGNLLSNLASGTSVSYTAGADITISGNVTIGTGTTFSGGSYNITVGENWINNGTFNGNTGTVIMTGGGTSISGSGTHNFNNVTAAATNITTAANLSITLTGNLATSSPGTFTLLSGGTLTMSGTSKTISGTGIMLENLIVSGTVTASSGITLTGNLTVNGTFNGTGGTVVMTGTSKTFSGTGTITFGTLSITGSVSSSASFTISNTLDIQNTFSASAGTATFSGTSYLNGTANLYNVTLNGTSLQLSANAVLGIANTYTVTAGTLNVTAAVPNTVNFNGTAAQTISASTFYNLTVSNSSTKTLGGAVTVNNDFTIASGTTFNGGTAQVLTILNNWINNGTFTASTGTVTLSGSTNTTVTGASTFNTLVLNKTATINQVTLQNNVSVQTLTMTSGGMMTGTNTLTITGNRSGNGIILGNIQHSHTFSLGVAYAFEGPNTTITLTGLTLTGSITMSVNPGVVADFPSGTAINREYDISSSGITLAATTLRFHYEDAELNGNNKSNLTIWRNTGSGWAVYGNTASSTTSNYVEQTTLLSLSFTGRYTLASTANVVRWNGSVSTDWNTAGNWTIGQGSPSRPPGTGDVVEIGTIAFTNQPVISTAVSVAGISFGSVQAATLTLATGGSLTTQGNIAGIWSANVSHTINVNNQALTVNGNLALSDGTTGHNIQLNVGNGSITVGGSLTQSGNAAITCSGTGAINIGGNFNYSSGTFSPGTGTVTYNGSTNQTVAGLTYNQLTISKTAGSAQIGSATTVNGNVTVSSGDLSFNAATTVSGNMNISSGATSNGGAIALTVGGNWNNSGVFTPASGTVNFTGSNAQNIAATTFNNLIINKTGSAATLTGNVVVMGNVSVNAGTMTLSTYNLNRSSPGGVFTLANGAALNVAGTGNFPANYTQYNLGNSSTVTYNGTGSQTVYGGISYGYLTLAGSGTQSLAANITVNSDLQIGAGATFNAGTYTINLYGNWNNAGTFNGGSGTITLNGSTKTITGTTTFNRLTVYGSYSVAGSNITYNGLLQIITGGSYDGGSGNATVNGDLINNGSLVSNGVTTFTGTAVQTIRFVNALVSNSSGVINFNGSVSPVLNSTSSPTYATLNINNTAGVSASVGWTVLMAFNISSGATFNGGVSTHTISGSFTNNGTVTSSGTLNFTPSSAQTIQLTGTSFNSTGTVIFGGTAPITITGTPTNLATVTIANTAGVTPATGWTQSADFHINGNGVFYAGANTFIVNGNVESNGTLHGGTSTFTMAAPSAILIGSDSTTFYNLVVNGNVTASSNFNVINNLTLNDTLDASVGMPVMVGSGPSLIGGTIAPFNLATLEVKKSNNAVVSLGRSLSLMTALDILSGVLDTGDSTITEDVTNGGALIIGANARLIVRGVNSLPAFDSYALDTLSYVEYGGTTQAIATVTPYGNLVISAAGNKTASAPITILSNFTLSNGTFIPGSFTDTLRGNWTMTGGTFTNTGATIYFSGRADQLVSSTGAFNNIQVKKASGQVVLQTNVTVNGILTFTTGNVRTGGNTLIMPAGATITGAAQNTGWVYGRLQKNVAGGAAVSRTFEVGDSLIYSPATALFASVTTAGNITGVVTDGSHPNIATSGIDGTKKVNRYWSLINSGTVFTTVNVTLNWVAADVGTGANTANFKVARYDGTNWTLAAVSAPLATSIQATGLTALGDLVVGELSLGAIWTGAISTNWFVTGNWSTAAIPAINTNVTIPAALVNYPLVSTGTATANNITIQTGATVTVSNAILQLAGTISGPGAINATAGTIVLNGVTAQTIPAGIFATNTLQSLTINNAAGVTLAGTLKISGILTPTAGQFSTAGFLTLLSTAAATALITGSGTGQVTGNVTMQRYLSNAFGYRYLSSPFQAATVSQLANDINLNASFPSLYRYDETRASTGWVSYTNTANVLTPMQGYAAQMGTSTAPITVDITGVVNNGSVTAPSLTNNNQPYTQGFNLIGNPYPSPIDWNAASGWTRTNVDNAVYYFNPGTTDQYTGTYSTYINGVSSDGIANNIIGSMQGFFVHVTNGTFPVTGAITINNNARVNALSPVFHRVSQLTPVLRMGAAFADDGAPYDPLVVYFDADGTPAFEKQLDAIKLMNTDPAIPNVYTLATDSSRLAIGAWSDVWDTALVIPVGIRIARAGWITFNTVSRERIPDDQPIYLRDAVTGQYTALTAGAKYRLYLEAGSYHQRFAIVFRKEGSDVMTSGAPVFSAYCTAGGLYAYFDKVPGEKCYISVTNIAGQTYGQKEFTGNGRHFLGSRYSNGIYIVSFQVNGKVVARKVFIGNR